MDELRLEMNRVLPRVRTEMRAAREAMRTSEARIAATRAATDRRAVALRAARPGMISDAAVGRILLSRRGIDLVNMNSDLASYFGKGSENGLLVAHADSSWAPLRAGDVILSVNGEPVREDNRIHISLDRSQENRVELLRKGKKETVVVKRQ
jgi:S1-C subfamily serine protease